MAGKKVRIFFLLFIFSVVIFSATLIYPSEEDVYINNEKGVKALDKGQYRKAIECFMRALRYDSRNKILRNNLSSAYISLGNQFLEKGEPYNAIDKFEQAVYYKPDNFYALINIGRIYYKKNNLKKAIYYLEKAYDINPGIKGLKDLLDKAKGESSIENKLSKLETSHFLIVSDDKINIDNLANIKISLEQAYSRVGSFLSHFPKNKTTVVLYPEALYEKAMGGRPYWSHAVFDGKIRIPLAKRIYSKEFLSQIIYHEYAHVVIRDLTKGNCPIWLNEGIACYAEGFVVSRNRGFFRDFIDSENFVPFEKLPDSYKNMGGAKGANLYYREFYLLANFLSDKFSASVIRDILFFLGTGTDISKAIKEATDFDMDEFGRSWHRYVKGKLGI